MHMFSCVVCSCIAKAYVRVLAIRDRRCLPLLTIVITIRFIGFASCFFSFAFFSAAAVVLYCFILTACLS